MSSQTVVLAINWIVGILIIGLTYLVNFNGAGSSSLVGSVFLLVTLLPNNLLRFERLSKSRKLRALARIRRELGIASGVWFVIHAALSIQKYFSSEISFFTQLTYREILPGFLSLIVFVLLLVTSNRWSQRLLGQNWQKLHSLVWLVLPLVLTHVTFVTLHYHGMILPPPFITYLGLMIFAAVEFFGLRQNFPNKNWQHSALVAVGCLICLPIILFLAANPAKI
ncbi:ferric reductase-like transmembrane domain-containing protein [Cylindrospermum sp. FACHB-282]|uniref:ferric reductase-like transmembrane domain-containing protein n=1 Tax=Cylindrospermum sp. FACHB-282 TaxID=2692794 RepID=UPI0016882551|nr:ferric reductase-like transmembrane domain-containing protein [Cylindrospermum sp. FACHB-282]MBD2387180.1 ferric reductase-like transmembrane domain-containing protein [Cylindrospermum sp. FACHB-282]